MPPDGSELSRKRLPAWSPLANKKSERIEQQEQDRGHKQAILLYFTALPEINRKWITCSLHVLLHNPHRCPQPASFPTPFYYHPAGLPSRSLLQVPMSALSSMLCVCCVGAQTAGQEGLILSAVLIWNVVIQRIRKCHYQVRKKWN